MHGIDGESGSTGFGVIKDLPVELKSNFDVMVIVSRHRFQQIGEFCLKLLHSNGVSRGKNLKDVPRSTKFLHIDFGQMYVQTIAHGLGTGFHESIKHGKTGFFMLRRKINIHYVRLINEGKVVDNMAVIKVLWMCRINLVEVNGLMFGPSMTNFRSKMKLVPSHVLFVCRGERADFYLLRDLC